MKQDKPVNVADQHPHSGHAEAGALLFEDALALYEPPFTFTHGYIYDAKDRMVMDAHRERTECGHVSLEFRVRGWGRIGYLPNAAKLQDAVGALIAQALTEFWSRAELPAPTRAPAPTKESAAAGCATLPDSAASTETGR